MSEENIKNISKYLEIKPDNNNSCISCTEPTELYTKCCKLNICKTCYFDWLKNSRECMHCKQDQMEFQEWYDNFRKEREFLLPTFENIISGNLQTQFLGFTAMATVVNANDEIIDNIRVNLSPEEVLRMMFGGEINIDTAGNSFNNSSNSSNSNYIDTNSANLSANFADMIADTVNPQNLMYMLNMFNAALNDIEDRLNDYEEEYNWE